MERQCKNCDNLFTIPKHNPKQLFCSRSCARSFCNRGVRKHGNAPKIIMCTNCGKETPNKKYCSNECFQVHRKKSSFSKIAKSGMLPKTKFDVSKTGKKFLIETRGHMCEVCGHSDWNGKPIPLQVHHINGKSKDERLHNVQLLCLNCHAQTNNYGGKNIGNGDREYRYIGVLPS